MAVRDTMASLISRTRDLLGDPSGSGEQLSDQQIQDALDQRRWDVRYQYLYASETISSVGGTGVTTWQDFYADRGDWEDGWTLQNGSWVDITSLADVKEPMIGHWHFPENQPTGCFITGSSYDINAAGADLCEMLIASIRKRAFNFSADGASYDRKQLVDNLIELRDSLRAHAYPGSIFMARMDVISNVAPEDGLIDRGRIVG